MRHREIQNDVYTLYFLPSKYNQGTMYNKRNMRNLVQNIILLFREHYVNVKHLWHYTVDCYQFRIFIDSK